MSVETVRSLSVFFPAYNEAANLPALIENCLAALRGLVDDFEIIIVNDGSKDRTGEVAEELARQHPEVRVVHHPKNRGYGGALISGFRAAAKDAVFFSDSDCQFDLREIAEFWRLIRKHAVVIGYRINRQDPWHRKLFGFCWSKFIQLMLGVRAHDLDCAFKMFRREYVADLDLGCRGAMISAELLALLKNKGLRWVEVGVHHYPRRAGTPTGGNPRVILRAFRELMKNLRRLRPQRRL